MREDVFASLRDWVEPAHPSYLRFYEELLAIYKLIKNDFQEKIDRAFDSVSSQIGFVVTTTMPAVLQVSEEGRITGFNIGGHLADTLFGKALGEVMSPIVGKDTQPSPWKAGNYTIYLIWYEALKLKLQTEWMEPAHFIKAGLTAVTQPEMAFKAVRPEVMEPAHWFNPAITIAAEEAISIAVIDEVYSDLHLADRVAMIRSMIRKKVQPEVMEPAHFQHSFAHHEKHCEAGMGMQQASPEEILKKIKLLLDKL